MGEGGFCNFIKKYVVAVFYIFLLNLPFQYFQWQFIIF